MRTNSMAMQKSQINPMNPIKFLEETEEEYLEDLKCLIEVC